MADLLGCARLAADYELARGCNPQPCARFVLARPSPCADGAASPSHGPKASPHCKRPRPLGLSAARPVPILRPCREPRSSPDREGLPRSRLGAWSRCGRRADAVQGLRQSRRRMRAGVRVAHARDTCLGELRGLCPVPRARYRADLVRQGGGAGW